MFATSSRVRRLKILLMDERHGRLIASRAVQYQVSTTSTDTNGNSFGVELLSQRITYYNRRVVHLIRDRRDVIVSHHHHRKHRDRLFCGTLSEFVRYSRSGESVLQA